MNVFNGVGKWALLTVSGYARWAVPTLQRLATAMLFLSLLCLSLSALPLLPIAAAAEAPEMTEERPPATTDRPDGGSVAGARDGAGATERMAEEKKQLQEDARRLTDNLKELFKDLHGLSRSMAEALTGTLSQWIEKNYDHLQRSQRERLQEFSRRLREDYAGLRELTQEQWRRLGESIADLLRMLEDQHQAPTDRIERPADGNDPEKRVTI